MQIEFRFGFYQKANESSDIYFNSIRNKIDLSYSPLITKEGPFFITADLDTIMSSEKTGIYLTKGEEKPRVILETLVVTFPDVGRDFDDVLEHLIEKFGRENISSYRIFEEVYVNGPR